MTLVPPKADTAVLRIAVQNGPALTYRYGTRRGASPLPRRSRSSRPAGDASNVQVTAVQSDGRVTARFAVVAEHVHTAGGATTAIASLELTSVAPRSLAHGCAAGALASLTLTDAGRRDAARLTGRGPCAFLGGAFSNGVAGSAKVAISP